MNRKTKLFINVLLGIIQKIVLIICGFIVPRYMLVSFGSSMNGLVSSINHFLGFISLLELGIGPVVTANLYEPLAKKNKEQLSKVIISAERFFRKIAFIFSIYVFVLVIVYPKYIKTDYDFLFTSSLLLIIAISTFANYFLGITYNLLLNADQKAYIPILLGISATVLNTIFIVVGVQQDFSIHKVMLFSTIAHLLKPIGQYLYVHKNYDIDKTLTLIGEPIKQKWNGFAQHLAFVVNGHIDVVSLTFFSSLINVSIYHIYFLVISGVTALAFTGTSGIEALFGNLLANKEKNKLMSFFSSVELFSHIIVTFLFTVTAITIVPFIKVYTKNINDANYNVPIFASLLVLAYFFRCLRVSYFMLVNAAGHFKETQNGAFISTLLNVVFTVSVVIKYGLNGVALGTLVAMLYHTLYYVWYLKSNIINRPIKHFVLYLIVDLFIGVLSYYACSSFEMASLNYYSWVVYGTKCFITTLIISLLFNFLLFKNKVKDCLYMLLNKK